MIALDARPRLSRAVRLKHDRARQRWMLLAPERGFVLNPSALAIVRRLDGTIALGELAVALAPDDADDVVAFVRALGQRRLVEVAPGRP
jgi:pyrroloquinoline quinone biosynthesis protein D